jgi:peptidoglycan/LPS O-acetylase OafA/YrhL
MLRRDSRGLPNLDFVRSIAVISVVVEHTLLSLGVLKLGPFPILYLGVMGVMVFFVHTTLVLMWSLERKPDTLDFYIRRAFRIYPLALVAIALVMIFHAPVAGTASQPFHYADPRWRNVAAQATLIPNMLTDKAPIMGVLWSLPYEVEMYVLLPVLFFFLRKNFSIIRHLGIAARVQHLQQRRRLQPPRTLVVGERHERIVLTLL